jgi:uncharacterized protein (TIGR00255 family)
MNSMTGFGRGDAAGEGVTWCVEVSSVNRKQLEVVANLPRELAELEPLVRAEVSACCSRGRVAVQVRCDTGAAGAATVKLNEPLAQQYANEARRLAASIGLAPDFTLADAMRWPGVLESERAAPDAATAQPCIQAALEAALKQFIAMRQTEGANLQADIESRLASIASLLTAIEARAGEVTALYRKALQQRLQDAGLPVDLNDERLIKEIALFADRCDISEETSRARSHLAQFAKYIAAKEALGRNMDFLSQELFREFNTMGSKANNAELAHLVVAAKTEIERIREQVQNVE